MGTGVLRRDHLLCADNDMSSGTRRLIRGALSMGGGRILAMGFSVLQVSYLTRWFSLPEYGLCAATAVLGVTGLLVAGVGARIGNELTVTLVRESPDEAALSNRRLFFSAFIMLAAASTLLIVATLLIRDALPWSWLINTADEQLLSRAKAGFVVALVSQFAALPFSLASFGFRAYHENELVAAQTVLTAGATLGLVIVASSTPRPLVVAMAAPFMANLFVGLGMFVGFVRRRRWLLTPIAEPWREVRAHLAGTGLFALVGTSFAVLAQPLPYVVSLTQGFEVAGTIDIYLKLFTMFLVVEGDMLAPLWPAYVAHREKADWQWVRRSLWASIALAVSLAAAACIGVWFLGPSITRWLTGLDLALSGGTLACLALHTLLYALALALSTFLNASGLVGVQAIACGGGALAMLWLSVRLGRGFGAAGAVMGVVISLAIVAAVLMTRTMMELLQHRNQEAVSG